jgi:hypothetical protein
MKYDWLVKLIFGFIKPEEGTADHDPDSDPIKIWGPAH